MKTLIKTILGLIVAAVILGIGYYHFFSKANDRQLRTYFHYEKNSIEELRSLNSAKQITPAEVFRWEENAYELVAKNKTGSTQSDKIYAYLMTAQRDAAFLSYNVHGTFKGSIETVSAKVLCIFFPDDCSAISPSKQTDPYAQKLAEVVMSKIQERIAEDDKGTKEYERPEGDQYWVAHGVAKGKTAGSWKTWLLQSGREFPLPPPPVFGSEADRQELKAVREAYENLDDRKKAAIAFWSGGPGTKRVSGLWLEKTSTLLKEYEVELEKLLSVRALVAMTIADVDIACGHYKYTYWTQRPFMRDNTIKTYMPTPNYPGYPANATAIAAASAVLLAHYFPQQAEKINAVAKEAGDSRIWSGIHFPVDVEQGADLGERIARELLRRQELVT